VHIHIRDRNALLLLPPLLLLPLQGKVEKDAELLLIIKSQAALLDTLTAKVSSKGFCLPSSGALSWMYSTH
jgi:hypothetical protein